jgi:ferredoxin-type protein NapF
MQTELNRADLIRGRFAGTTQALRPPYAIAEKQFVQLCDGCDDCRDACESDVIGFDAHGYPILLFGEAECTFCEACATACPTGALSLEEARPWNVLAHIKPSCLSLNGVTCRSCEEGCGDDAIQFKLMTGGRALPVPDPGRCTGCGKCAVVCPNQSIDMRSRQAEEVLP